MGKWGWRKGDEDTASQGIGGKGGALPGKEKKESDGDLEKSWKRMGGSET